MLPCHTPTAALTSTGGCLLLIVLSTRVCICETVVVSYSRSIISKKEHTGVRTERSGRPVVDARAVFAARVGCTRGEPHARSSPVVIILRHAPPNSPGTRPISLQHHLPTPSMLPTRVCLSPAYPRSSQLFHGERPGGGGGLPAARKSITGPRASPNVVRRCSSCGSTCGPGARRSTGSSRHPPLAPPDPPAWPGEAAAAAAAAAVVQPTRGPPVRAWPVQAGEAQPQPQPGPACSCSRRR